MRVMVMIKANPQSEAGEFPSEPLLADMLKFNEELMKAGVLKSAGGLLPSVQGKRLVLSGGKRTVIDGPFAETKELIAGYWLWQVKSLDEAIEWVKRVPNPTGEEGTIEIRPVFEPDDFGDNLTPEVREQGRRLREQTEAG
jgi:hypothetical protein